MAQKQDVTSRVMKLDEKLADWIPPRDTWDPADKALYKPVDLFRVPLEEARDMQLKAIKFAFTNHYSNNKFYHKYCKQKDVHPDDIKTVDDLDTIPLIPDTTFKQYPSGKDFAFWLGTIFTGDLPQIVIKGANPTYDDVINAFNAAGLVVGYTTGTSGQSSVIPRDMRTFLAAQYAAAKAIYDMLPDFFSDHSLQLFPNPKKTNIMAGKATAVLENLCKDVQYALDIEIPTQLTQRSMTENKQRTEKATSSAQNVMQQIIDKAIEWCERYERTEDTIGFVSPPFMFLAVMNKLQKEGKRFDFGERGSILTSGGWKIQENVRIPLKDFRKQVRDVLGIPENRCLDIYGMSEGNWYTSTCPEGHYLHAPYTYFKPLVLDKNLTPAEYGEWGRLAFLDAISRSYPGFVITGDQVRMLEHCPVCDRPGPVLEPEIQRAKGEEVRGCAEVIKRVLAEEGTKNPR